MASIHRIAAAFLLVCGQVSAAELPPIDRADDAPKFPARLNAIAAPADLEVASSDERYGVPSFVWSRLAEDRAGSRATTSMRREDFAGAARSTVSRLAPLYGLDRADVDGLELHRVHDTGRGAVIAHFRQRIDAIEVFRDELSLEFDRQGNFVAAAGFVPGATLARVRVFERSALQAATDALSDRVERAPALSGIPSRAGDPYEHFEGGDVRAKKVWFHLPTELVPAYYVEVISDVGATAYVISARADGAILFRHSLEASAAYSYRVWADANGPLDSPNGTSFTPHPTGLPDFSKPPFVPPSLVTLQNGAISTDDPWLPPGATETLGNNVDALADLVAPIGFDEGQDLRATTTGPNAFDRVFDPAIEPDANDEQVLAAVTQSFYTTNWLHDWYYDAGFDEAGGNGQASNFGRGGLEDDRMLVRSRAFDGFGSAQMVTPADGAMPRLESNLSYPAGVVSIDVLAPNPYAGNYFAWGSLFLGPQTCDVTAPLVHLSQKAYATSAGATFPTGDGPEWVTLADVDGDGNLDAVTANLEGDDVSVHLGDGAGSFAAAAAWPAGDGPFTAEAGKLDADAFPDLVVANYIAGTVSLLRNDGAGGFLPKVDYPTGPGCAAAALAKLDAGPTLDVVTANTTNGTVSVRLGDGAGGLGAKSDYAVGTGPNWVAAGDLNGDGKADLVTANSGSSSITVLLGDGAGAFGSRADFSTGSMPLTLALGDVDHDGDLDAVTADASANTVSVLRNQGAGAFAAPVPFPVGASPVTVRLADVNRDAVLDIVVTSNVVTTLLGKGNGAFHAGIDHPVGATPYGVAIADLDGNGDPELVSANFASDDLTVLVGSVTSSCDAPYVTDLEGRIVVLDEFSDLCPWQAQFDSLEAAGAVGILVPQFFGGGMDVGIPVFSIVEGIRDSLVAAFESGPASVHMQRASSLKRDVALDNHIMAHEWGHFISNRMIGDASGLSNRQGRGMGEGWADLTALLMTLREGDDPHGTYAMGSHVSNSSVVATNDFYYGSGHRQPYSTQLAKNGLTFKHISAGEPLPPGSVPSLLPNNELHMIGEVWCTMLWECCAALLADTPRLTFTQARERMRDYVVAAYQMTPNAPTITEARDALLAAALANDPADYQLFWQAFAKRGCGAGAVSPPRGSVSLVGVVESHSTRARLALQAAPELDDGTACDADGILDAGETGHATFRFKNVGIESVADGLVTVSSPNTLVHFPAGATFPLAPLAPQDSVTLSIPVTIEASAAVQSVRVELSVTSSDLNGAQSFLTPEILGNANLETSGALETAQIGAGWTFEGWSPSLVAPGDWRFSAPEVQDEPIALILTSPPLEIGSGGPFRVFFDHAYSFASAFDGGVIELSDDDGETWSAVGAFMNPPYGGMIAGDTPAFTGTSVLVTQTLDFGVLYSGQTVRLRFLAVSVSFVSGPGWSIAELRFENVVNQPFSNLMPQLGTCSPLAVTDPALPQAFDLALVGRHPAAGAATLAFALPRAGHVSLTVHDVAGRRVASLIEGDRAAGHHTVRWDRGRNGAEIASGVYFVRLVAGGQSIVRRVVVVKS